MSDDLELTGALFKPNGPGTLIYDDPTGPIEVDDLELAGPDGVEAEPRGLTAQRLFQRAQ